MMVMPDSLAPDAQRLLKILKSMSPEELNDIFSEGK